MTKKQLIIKYKEGKSMNRHTDITVIKCMDYLASMAARGEEPRSQSHKKLSYEQSLCWAFDMVFDK